MSKFEKWTDSNFRADKSIGYYRLSAIVHFAVRE